MTAVSCIYLGRVVHKRMRPKRHALDYRVFSLLLDIDEVASLAKRLRFFSHNKWNIFSFYDGDHGAGDGRSIRETVAVALRTAGRPFENRRVALLAYPRLFGYAFNPLSVYYVRDPSGRLETLVYEVSNTFGERTSYVVAAGARNDHGVFAQACRKEMYVSPFAAGRGGYGFRVTEPGREALVGVHFSDAQGSLIKTHFRGTREELSDLALLKLLFVYPLMTLKVIGAIHFEAAKLWFKGIPITGRHVSPKYAVYPSKQVED